MTAPSRAAVEALFIRAMDAGARRRSQIAIDWDVAGNCEHPYTREIFARPDDQTEYGPGKPVPLLVIMTVRCRRCGPCRRQRQAMWSARAILEYRQSYRTWLGTLTLRPEDHDMVLNMCRAYEAERGTDFEVLSPAKQFLARHNRISRYLTLWLKRVRKNSSAKLRYLLVCEAHKNNLPHYHALIHEPECESRVTKRVLQAGWPHGFSSFKLLDDDESSGATYACKYLSKSALSRVRASVGYGRR